MLEQLYDPIGIGEVGFDSVNVAADRPNRFDHLVTRLLLLLAISLGPERVTRTVIVKTDTSLQASKRLRGRRAYAEWIVRTGDENTPAAQAWIDHGSLLLNVRWRGATDPTRRPSHGFCVRELEEGLEFHRINAASVVGSSHRPA